MKSEQLKYYDNNQDGQKLLTVLLNRSLFPENGRSLTLDQAIQQDATALAQEIITELNSNLVTLPEDIVQKITPRSISWNYQDIAIRYQNSDNLESLITISANETKTTGESNIQTEEVVARQWWANTIGYETRAVIKRQQTANSKKTAYKQEVATIKIKRLQQEPDPEYGDAYNRLVCLRGNKFGTTDLKSVRQIIDSEIIGQVSDTEIINMLTFREIAKQIQRLSLLINIGLTKLNNPEKAIALAALVYELDRIKTDDVWEQKIRLQEIIFNGLNGNQIYFVTMLCTINEFDYQGSYNLNPNLNAYKNNPKVEPVPLIIDEMASIVNLFQFYGINCSLNMFVADTDYTEIGANGPITDTNLANLKKYMTNLKDYVIKYNNQVNADTISSVTDNNSLYQATKTKILEWVVKRRNDDFNRTWGQKWEDNVESRSETFGKKKLCPPGDIRRESLRVAQNIWAVNAAQGAIFSNLGQNTIILSTERRNRDANYVVDKETTADFPPVLYVLKAAENWNRKIINKNIFEAV